MAELSFPVGPFSSLYVGDVSPATGALIQITCPRTRGSVFTASEPQTYEDAVGDAITSDRQFVNLPFRFLGDEDDNVVRLSMRNSISTPGTPDAPGGKTKYTVLVIDDKEPENTILIPNCYVIKGISFNKEKSAQTEFPITFHMKDRNPCARLWYREDLETILALSVMSGRSPF